MKFYEGMTFQNHNVTYRVRKGNRCDGDLVIEFKVDGWYMPPIAHTYILTNFKFQVEENNYGENGKVKKGRGGWYLLDKIRSAAMHGWQQGADEIIEQREALAAKKTEAAE